ncbi:hypothetical protein E4T42_06143 [Aureobasidium subglaciale]|nr:hypothetical protein E4T42_06143 [Aureobasidium subglaciale]
MIAGYTLVGCLAALSAVAHAQDEVPQEYSIFDLVNTPFTFTDCAAPSEMQTCWESQNFTNEYLDPTYDTCPDADPGPIVLNALQQQYIDSTRRGNNNSLSQCASRLANFNCADYGFTEYANNASDYARLTPLHSATGTFSDVNGILTSPVSGATYTWTAWNMTYTITAASVEAVATRTASATGKISGSVTGSVTGTAIGAPSTNTGAAAPTLIAVQYPAAALMGLSGLALALL